jgi:hypothetical protein
LHKRKYAEICEVKEGFLIREFNKKTSGKTLL